MNHQMPRSLIALIWGCALIVFVGICAVAWSTFQVPFTDESAAMNAFAHWCGAGYRADEVIGREFYSYRTTKYLWINIGVGLIPTGLSVSALALCLLKTRRSIESWLHTPAYRWTFIAVGVGVVMLLWATTVYGLMLDLDRFMFPPCADSIAIPMFELSAAVVVVIPLLSGVGFLITRLFGHLPVPLTHWDSSRPLWSICVSVVCGVVGMMLLALFIETIASSSSIGAPTIVLGLYLVAATRAALVSPASDCPTMLGGVSAQTPSNCHDINHPCQ